MTQTPHASQEMPAAHRHDAARADIPRRAPATRQRTISLLGREIAYTQRMSTRARRLRLVIKPDDGLQVTTPTGVAQARVEAILREKASWILTTLDRFERQRAETPAPTPLQNGSALRCFGVPLILALAPSSDGRIHARYRDGTLSLALPDGDAGSVARAVEAWYRREARHIFEDRVARWNAIYGFNFGRIAVKDQKSRWGSCSHQGNLNFNWRLLLAPPDVLDYIVIHELAHLAVPDHSPRFWEVVARACPGYRTHRLWLRRHGHELRLI